MAGGIKAKTLNINDLKPVHGILMGLVLGAILVAALHFLVKVPLSDKKVEVEKNIAATKKELSENQALVSALPGYKKQHAELAKALTDLAQSKLTPDENPVRWGNTLIDDLVKDYNMKLGQFTPAGTGSLNTTTTVKKKTKPVFSPYEEFKVEMDLVGNYHQVGRFLASIEKTLPCSRIDSLTLRPSGKNFKDGLRVNLKIGFLKFSERGFPTAKRPAIVPAAREDAS